MYSRPVDALTLTKLTPSRTTTRPVRFYCNICIEDIVKKEADARQRLYLEWFTGEPLPGLSRFLNCQCTKEVIDTLEEMIVYFEKCICTHSFNRYFGSKAADDTPSVILMDKTGLLVRCFVSCTQTTAGARLLYLWWIGRLAIYKSFLASMRNICQERLYARNSIRRAKLCDLEQKQRAQVELTAILSFEQTTRIFTERKERYWRICIAFDCGAQLERYTLKADMKWGVEYRTTGIRDNLISDLSNTSAVISSKSKKCSLEKVEYTDTNLMSFSEEPASALSDSTQEVNTFCTQKSNQRLHSHILCGIPLDVKILMMSRKHRISNREIGSGPIFLSERVT